MLFEEGSEKPVVELRLVPPAAEGNASGRSSTTGKRSASFENYFFMTKDGLVDAVMKAAEIETKAAAHRAVEAVFDTITKSLGRGEDVAITGFGTFRVAKRAARQGRNPKTGETIQIPASVKPKFRAGKALKEAVK
jgi:DNA-binding protein HU-beta